MLSREEFIRYSLEYNLLFNRIIKEHFIFVIAFLSIKNPNEVQVLMSFKNRYEELLAEAVEIADQVVSKEAINSGEFVTKYTLDAEEKTQVFTGIPINTKITEAELMLRPGREINPMLEAKVSELNQKAITLTTQAINAKNTLDDAVKACKIFTFSYPALLEHVIEEAEFYLEMLNMLQRKEAMDTIIDAIKHEIFWNHIMEEHGKFIRGLLDPSENELIAKANSFADEFEELTLLAMDSLDNTEMFKEVTRESIIDTKKIRDFKEQGTKGILKCEIKSIILPLLADHVLREANYYLRMLKMFEYEG